MQLKWTIQLQSGSFKKAATVCRVMLFQGQRLCRECEFVALVNFSIQSPVSHTVNIHINTRRQYAKLNMYY